MGEDLITLTYEYRKLSNVTIRYIDSINNEEIQEPAITTYKQGDEYTTLPINIEGYVVTKTPDNANGTVETENIEVVYEYKKISNGLVVKYVDKISNELLDTEEYTGNEGDIIQLVEKEIEGYVIDTKPEYDQVTLSVEAKEEIYYYRRKVTIEIIGVDKINNNNLYIDIINGIEGDEYTATGKTLEGYSLVETPENETVIFDRNTIQLVYKYKKISDGVNVKYVDDYENIILDEENINGLEGDNYSTSQKEYEKYDFKEIEGQASGNLTVSKINVVYHYEKKDSIVNVVYQDEEGNEIFSEVLQGKVDEEYKVEEKEIEHYRIKEYPQNTEGIFELEEQQVVFIVEKIPGTIIVQYQDEEGNILDTDERYGYVGEKEVFEAKKIEGYTTDSYDDIILEYIDGELVYVIKYSKMILPDTSDINMSAAMIVLIASVGAIIVFKEIKKKSNN